MRTRTNSVFGCDPIAARNVNRLSVSMLVLATQAAKALPVSRRVTGHTRPVASAPANTLRMRDAVTSSIPARRPARIAPALISMLRPFFGSNWETCGGTPAAARSAMKK